MGMSEGNPTDTLGTVSVTEWVEDRRRTERVPVSLPVHVCSSDGAIDKFEEVSTTLNASRDGVYFSSDIQTYKVGMSLVVTFPFSHAPERNVHFFGKVVRIDALPESRFGIAVELVMTIANRQKLRAVAETVRR
jgi:PilZ domain